MVLRVQKDENLLCVVPSDYNNQHNTYCCTFTFTGVISSCLMSLKCLANNEGTLVFTWLVSAQVHRCLICLSFLLAKVVKGQIDHNIRADNSCCRFAVKENV